MKSKVLLISSEKVGDTGRVSFSYIFQDKTLDAYSSYPEQCAGPFGLLTKIDGGFHFNLFEGGKGFICGGPIYPDRIGYHFNEDLFPEACNMLCTKEIADDIKPILEGMGHSVDILFSEQTLLTA